VQASKLTTLVLAGFYLFHMPDDAISVIAACTGHPTIKKLSFQDNRASDEDQEVVGEALRALVAAPESKLEQLILSDCRLGDNGVTPLFNAVASNATLRVLHCGDCNISETCARDVILPAVRSNSSLLKLIVRDRPAEGNLWLEGLEMPQGMELMDLTDKAVEPSPAHLEAEALVAQRRRRG